MKPLRITRSEAAVRDMEELHLFIAMENPLAADRFLDALHRTLRLLARHFRMGPRYRSDRPELAEIRFFPVPGFGNYLVFYRADLKLRELRVIRVLHGSRDIPRILE